MKFAALMLALFVSMPLAAQEKAKARAKKKAAEPRPAAQAHKKPTPDQIRRFNELQKKQQAAK